MSSRALTKARSVVVDAERDHDRWVAALADAEADAARALEADVADPADLGAAGENAARTVAKVAAARRALIRVEARLGEVRRDVLLAEADDEEGMAATVARELTGLQGKVEALLGQLETLNGIRYEVPADELISRRVKMGERVSMPLAKTDALDTQARIHRIHAAVLRATARSGRVPLFFHELEEQFPGSWASSLIDPGIVPTSARAYAATLDPDPVEVDLVDVAAE